MNADTFERAMIHSDGDSDGPVLHRQPSWSHQCPTSGSDARW
jgi:hypothetical protein